MNIFKYFLKWQNYSKQNDFMNKTIHRKVRFFGLLSQNWKFQLIFEKFCYPGFSLEVEKMLYHQGSKLTYGHRDHNLSLLRIPSPPIRFFGQNNVTKFVFTLWHNKWDLQHVTNIVTSAEIVTAQKLSHDATLFEC